MGKLLIGIAIGSAATIGIGFLADIMRERSEKAAEKALGDMFDSITDQLQKFKDEHISSESSEINNNEE